MKMIRYGVLYALVFAIVIILDRITKVWALTNLEYSRQITSFLSFELIFNRGISWGMFNQSGVSVFSSITALIIFITFALTWYAYERMSKGHIILGECMVIAGALSNTIDRFLYQGVIDFILFSYGSWSFPVFNVADCAIVVGVALMFITYQGE